MGWGYVGVLLQVCVRRSLNCNACSSENCVSYPADQRQEWTCSRLNPDILVLHDFAFACSCRCIFWNSFPEVSYWPSWHCIYRLVVWLRNKGKLYGTDWPTRVPTGWWFQQVQYDSIMLNHSPGWSIHINSIQFIVYACIHYIVIVWCDYHIETTNEPTMPRQTCVAFNSCKTCGNLSDLEGWMMLNHRPESEPVEVRWKFRAKSAQDNTKDCCKEWQYLRLNGTVLFVLQALRRSQDVCRQMSTESGVAVPGRLKF